MGFILNIVVKYLSKGTDGIAACFKFLRTWLQHSSEWFHGWGIIALITSVLWPFVEGVFDDFTRYLYDVPGLVLSQLLGYDTSNFIMYLVWQFQLPLLFTIAAAIIVQYLAFRALYFYALIVKIVRSLIP